MTRREVDQKTLDQITEMSRQLAALTGEVAALSNVKSRTADRNKLLDEIEAMKREKATLIEEHDRRERDTKHEVGLLRKQWEQDKEHQERQIELKQQEAVLKVREENLTAERKRFEEQMEFARDQMKAEVDRLVAANQSLLNALPNVAVRLTDRAAPEITTGRRT